MPCCVHKCVVPQVDVYLLAFELLPSLFTSFFLLFSLVVSLRLNQFHDIRSSETKHSLAAINWLHFSSFISLTFLSVSGVMAFNFGQSTNSAPTASRSLFGSSFLKNSILSSLIKQWNHSPFSCQLAFFRYNGNRFDRIDGIQFRPACNCSSCTRDRTVVVW